MTFDKTIKWIQTMPRGTTIVVCMSASLLLGGWLWALEEEVNAVAEETAVAVAKVEATQATAEDTNKRIQTVDEKLDRLLEIVIEVKTKQDIANGAAPKPKKEKN